MKRYKNKQDHIAKNAKKILNFLEKNKEDLSPFLIICHNFPDPDTLASGFTLYYLATEVYGIQAKMVYGGAIGRTENREMVKILKIPAHKYRVSYLKKFKHFALVDTQPSFRNNLFPENKHADMVIDQHASDKPASSDLFILDTECGATSVLFAKALLLKGVDVPKNLATALTYGILTDTLNLYRANKEEVIQTYLDILPFCDLRDLAHIQNPTRPKKFFMVLARAIQNAKTRSSVLISHLQDIDSPDLVAQCAEFLLTYHRMTWVMCTGRYRGKLYVSLRTTKTNMNAGEVLRAIVENRGQAGGHGAIAGGSFKVSKNQDRSVWSEAEDLIASKFLKRLRVKIKGDFHYPFRQKMK